MILSSILTIGWTNVVLGLLFQCDTNIDLKVYVELLVHPEAIAKKIVFDGLTPKILFYKSFKTFCDILKGVNESKNSKIFFL